MNNLASVKTKLGAQIGVYNAMNGLNLLYSSSTKNNQLTLQIRNNSSYNLNINACANAPDDVLTPDGNSSWFVLCFDDATISQSALEGVQVSKVTIGGEEMGTSDWHLAVQSVKFSSTPLKTQMGLVVYTKSGVVLDENKDLEIELGNVSPNNSQEGAPPAYGALIWCYTLGNGGKTLPQDLGHINIPWMVRDGAAPGQTLPLDVVFGQSTYSLLKSTSYEFTNADIDKADNAVSLTPESYGSSVPNRLGFDLSFGDRHGIAANQSSSLFVEVLTLDSGNMGSLIPGLNATSALASSLSADTTLNVDVKDVKWSVDSGSAVGNNGVYRWGIYFPNNEITSSDSEDQNPHLEFGDFCSGAKEIEAGVTPVCIWWKDIPNYEDGCLWLAAVKKNPVPKVALATTHKSADASSQEVVWIAYAAQKAVLSDIAGEHSVALNGASGTDFVFNLSDFSPKDISAAEGEYIIEALDTSGKTVDQKAFTIKYLPLKLSDLKALATTTTGSKNVETNFTFSATTHNVLQVEVTPMGYGTPLTKDKIEDVTIGPYKGSWNQYFQVTANGPGGPVKHHVLSENMQNSPIVPELVANFFLSKKQLTPVLQVTEITPDGTKVIDFGNDQIQVNINDDLVEDWFLDYNDLYSWRQENKSALYYAQTNYEPGKVIDDFATSLIEVNWDESCQLQWSVNNMALGPLNDPNKGSISSYFPMFPLKVGSSDSFGNKTLVSNGEFHALSAIPAKTKGLGFSKASERYKGRQCLINGKPATIVAQLSSSRTSANPSVELYFLDTDAFELSVKIDMTPTIQQFFNNKVYLSDLNLDDFDISADGTMAYLVVNGLNSNGRRGSVIVKASVNWMYQTATGGEVDKKGKPIIYHSDNMFPFSNLSISTSPYNDLLYLMGVGMNRYLEVYFSYRVYLKGESMELLNISPENLFENWSRWGYNLPISPVVLPEPETGS